ncbi:MAG: hypothetical protein ACYS7Y_04150 [Planctomycetota bacterium]
MKDISPQRITELLDAEAKLQALEAGGVDNWEGYSEALREYHKEQAKNEAVEQLVTDVIDVLCEGVHEPAGRGCGFGITDEAAAEADRLLRDRIEDIVGGNY